MKNEMRDLRLNRPRECQRVGKETSFWKRAGNTKHAVTGSRKSVGRLSAME